MHSDWKVRVGNMIWGFGFAVIIFVQPIVGLAIACAGSALVYVGS